MVNEHNVENFKLWLDLMIDGLEESIGKEEEKGEWDTRFMRGYLKSLNDIKNCCFDGGLYDLEV